MAYLGPLICRVGVLALLAAVGLSGVEAQSIAGCTLPIQNMTPCFNFITGSTNGNGSAPSSDCCTAIAAILNGGVTCLCQFITTSNPLGFPVNRTLSLSLPGLCKVKSPPLNQCQESAGVPFLAPAPSPGSSLAPAPMDGPAPSGTSPLGKAPAPSGRSADPPIIAPAGSRSASFTPANTISPASYRGTAAPKAGGIDHGTSGAANVLPSFVTLLTVFAALILAGAGW